MFRVVSQVGPLCVCSASSPPFISAGESTPTTSLRAAGAAVDRVLKLLSRTCSSSHHQQVRQGQERSTSRPRRGRRGSTSLGLQILNVQNLQHVKHDTTGDVQVKRFNSSSGLHVQISKKVNTSLFVCTFCSRVDRRRTKRDDTRCSPVGLPVHPAAHPATNRRLRGRDSHRTAHHADRHHQVLHVHTYII